MSKTIFVNTHLGYTFVYNDVESYSCINGNLRINYLGKSTGSHNEAVFPRFNYAGYVVMEKEGK